jgi:PII-like signaling protein
MTEKKKRLEHVSDISYGLLRIYFRRGSRRKRKGFLGALSTTPEYELVIKAAKEHGIPFGKAKHSHLGFAEDEQIQRDLGELPNPMLPVYVELVGEREMLMSFCEAEHELLKGKAMFFSEVHKWKVT